VALFEEDITTRKRSNNYFDQQTAQGYINGAPVDIDEYNRYVNLPASQKLDEYGIENPISANQYGQELPIDIPISQRDKDGNVTNYKVFYDDKGGTTIRPVDANGELKPNEPAIYKDGVWDRSQLTSNSNVFVPGEQRWNNNELDQIDAAIKTSTTNHINATAPGTVKPQWLKKDNIKVNPKKQKSMKELEMWSKKANYPTSNTNSGTGRGYEGGSGNGQALMEGTKKAFSGAEASDGMFKKIVKYPMDMANNMDHMFIQCYSYRAPYAKTFDGKYGEGLLQPGKQRESGLAFGAERYSPYKKKLGAGIKMPMPNNMTDENGRSWNDESMTNKQMGGAQIASKNVIGSILTGDLFGTGPSIRNTALNADMLTQESTRGLIAAEKIEQLATVSGLSAESIMQRSVGVISNSNTELLFAGVILRSFEYQWTMSPRNRLEAANVRMIIRAFKQWSAPKKTRKVDNGANTNVGKAGGPSFFLGTPNIFRLRFVTNGNRSILGVNKFKPCALTNVSLNYTPEGQWLAYENGMPIAVSMSLRFAELEPIYDTDYSEDVAEDRQYDPNDPESTGDLYPISEIDQNSPYSSDVGY
tara:strand:- start:763 stop:2523 length:1761 start_codon:yes stop_codon:yes gene_type:complete